MNQKKQENPWINLIVNVAIPMYIMTKMASADKLGPLNAVLVATAFPLAYGFYDFWKNSQDNCCCWKSRYNFLKKIQKFNLKQMSNKEMIKIHSKLD